MTVRKPMSTWLDYVSSLVIKSRDIHRDFVEFPGVEAKFGRMVSSCCGLMSTF